MSSPAQSLNTLAKVIKSQNPEFLANADETLNPKLAGIIKSENSEDTRLFKPRPFDPFGEYTLYSFQQSKQISQLIAFIWLWVDENGDGDNEKSLKIKAAKDLKSAFDHPYKEGNTTLDPDSSLLWDLLTATPNKNGNNLEKALYWVFPNFEELRLNHQYIFPIFKPEDKKYFTLQVSINTFNGISTDPTANNNNSKFGWIIPNPPRPQLGELTVTKPQLQEWVTYYETDQYFSENPYIPTSTC